MLNYLPAVLKEKNFVTAKVSFGFSDIPFFLIQYNSLNLNRGRAFSGGPTFFGQRRFRDAPVIFICFV